MAKTTIDFVMGKGGVGRTTVSMLLAQHYAQRGEKTIIVECNGCADIPDLYSKVSQGYNPTQLTPLISSISVSPMSAIEDYVVQQLKMRRLYRLIFENRLVAPLIEAAPGLHDAVQLGKIYDLQISGQWDRIVVDCPATGHGVSLISAAKTMMDLSRRGPLYSQSKLVEDIVQEHGRVVMVTLPEELPSRETLQLWHTMRSDFHSKVLGLVINQWNEYSPTLTAAFLQADTLDAMAPYTEYQTVYKLFERQHREQQTWHDWLVQKLGKPNNISTLKYNKWSTLVDSRTNLELPPLTLKSLEDLL